MNGRNIEISIMKVVSGRDCFIEISKFAPKQQSSLEKNRNIWNRIFPREREREGAFRSSDRTRIEVGAAREVFTLARFFCRKWDLNWAGSPFVKIVFTNSLRKVESASLVKRAVVVGIHNGFNRWKNWPVKWVLFLLAFREGRGEFVASFFRSVSLLICSFWGGGGGGGGLSVKL